MSIHIRKKDKPLNIFLDKLFGDYWSISPQNFKKRCEGLGKDHSETLKYLKAGGYVRVLKLGHVEFVKYQ